MKAKPQVSRPGSLGLGEGGEGFSLEEAIAQGLIPPDLLRGMEEAVEREPPGLEGEAEPEPEAGLSAAREMEMPAEEPEVQPEVVAEAREDKTFSLQEAIAQGLIDPALLGLEDIETDEEDA